MSTKNFKTKAIFITFLVIFISLLINFTRQAFVYYRTMISIAQKEKEIQALQEKQKALEIKLQEVQSLKFLDKQSREILGIGDATGSSLLIKPEEKTTVYSGKMPSGSFFWQQWLDLFGF